ncbi:hypothetical protein SXHG_00025 [Synechococcus phage MRHenn-2013a]|nr:hypothetical protein SXHG_00025 [Synechococcus phage MRHenn-2013a]
MCGIVGVASRGAMTAQMKEFFAQLLYHDVVRGEHATGIAAVDTLTQSVEIFKKAMPSYRFLYEPGVAELFDNKKNFNIFIGHNRHATMGDKTKDIFAHPFQHGHITGVHNGTIRDQTLLDDHRLFDVDSDNLFYHMSQNGLDHTLERLNGAFALVWYNSEDNTLNFIRNDERPMCIGVLDNECVVWASEMGMLRWLVRRHRTLKFKKQPVEYENDKKEKVKYDEEMCYNLEKGDHLSFGFDGRVTRKPVSTKKTFPTFPAVTYHGWTSSKNSGGYDRWDGRNSTYSHDNYGSKHNKEANDMLHHANKAINLRSVVGARLVELIPSTYSNGKQAALFEFIGSVSRFPILLYNGGYDKVVEELTADDIGRVFYGDITTAYTPTGYSEKKAINKYGDNEWIFSFNQIDRKSPGGKAYFPFSQVKAEELDAIRDALAKKDNGEQMILLTPHQNAVRTSVKNVGNESVDNTLLKEVNSLSNGSLIVRLANAKIPRLSMIDFVKENNFRCGACSGVLSAIKVSDLYLLNQKDRQTGIVLHHLACCKECHRELYDWVIDECKDEVIGNE